MTEDTAHSDMKTAPSWRGVIEQLRLNSHSMAATEPAGPATARRRPKDRGACAAVGQWLGAKVADIQGGVRVLQVVRAGRARRSQHGEAVPTTGTSCKF